MQAASFLVHGDQETEIRLEQHGEKGNWMHTHVKRNVWVRIQTEFICQKGEEKLIETRNCFTSCRNKLCINVNYFTGKERRGNLSRRIMHYV